MIAAIHQPSYLGYAGLFARMAQVDTWVILDHVAFDRSDYQHRVKIRARNAQGWQWLTVPVKHPCQGVPINQVQIDNSADWGAQHWQIIKQEYRRAPYWKRYSEDVREMLTNCRWIDLVNPAVFFIANAFDWLGFSRRHESGSRMNITSTKSQLNLDICRAVGADVYLSGPGGHDYLDESLFRAAGIEVRYDEWRHPTYPQIHGGFVPGLSALDLLFNCGPYSHDVIMSGLKKE